MTKTTTHPDTPAEGGEAQHPPYLAHHFDTPRQQYESGKLGMWIFLATEVLMFGGLFCAYAVYRANHPEVFQFAHQALDVSYGAINTVILIASSFTMAWAVRAAQLGQRKLLPVLLSLTLVGGLGFMVIKGIEYSGKWQHGLWVGPANAFYYKGGSPANPESLEHTLETGLHGEKVAPPAEDVEVEPAEPTQTITDEAGPPAGTGGTAAVDPEAEPGEQSIIEAPPAGPDGLVPSAVAGAAPAYAAAKTHEALSFEQLSPLEQERTHLFFQIYYLMTGLHGIHVLVGMGLIGWILVRAMRAHFGPSYFIPVDLVGLYWHLVDLIWIFLFPLLYLIH
ncbi:MAG: cytochrome c oxidase subunit 3 family protein [Phycisphaeraceae bacterium]